MKKIVLMMLLFLFVLTGCKKILPQDLGVSDYAIEECVYVSSVSSLTPDYITETHKGQVVITKEQLLNASSEEFDLTKLGDCFYMGILTPDFNWEKINKMDAFLITAEAEYLEILLINNKEEMYYFKANGTEAKSYVVWEVFSIKPLLAR